MKKTVLFALAFLVALGVAAPPAAEARVFVGVGVGGCCYGGGYGYGGYPYYPPYDPYYVAPPPVVYAVPPAATVVYPPPSYGYQAAPAPTTMIAAPPPAAAPAPAPAPSSAAFIDSQGRTCRHVQITSASDTVCLQPDGSWRTVQ